METSECNPLGVRPSVHPPFTSAECESQLTLTLESPLIKREGCFESQGAYKEFKALQDKGQSVSTRHYRHRWIVQG
jgi:hypothetical protein